MGGIVRVAVRAESYAYDRPYTYALPPELEGKIRPGMRLIVPFGRGNRPVQALVLDMGGDAGEPAGVKMKEAVLALDSEPVVSEKDLRLLLWMRDKYFCTCFDALRACIPEGMDFREDSIAYSAKTPEKAPPKYAKDIYDYVAAAGRAVSLSELRKAFPGQELQKALNALVKSGALHSDNHRSRGVYEKIEKFAAISGEYDGLRLGKNQKEALAYLEGAGEAAVKDIAYYTGAGLATLRSLERLGVVEIKGREILRLAFDRSAKTAGAEPPELNGEQSAAFETLSGQLSRGKPSAALLHGVTGSGKTFVYIRLIGRVLEQGRSAVVLVPEIALTPQLLEIFYSHFGERVAILHSGLGAGERYDEWRRIRSGAADVVIGTRSAVFAPLGDIGLIIIDEEQEYTYKSERAPRYHARDIAKFRAVSHNALLLLGSATPSLESMYAAKTGRYALCTLSRRYCERCLPEVIFADMRGELRRGNGGQISALLAEKMRGAFGRGEQCILFLNRRGASRQVICQSCGYTPKCPRCSVSMTHHSANNRLMCHYCGYSEKMIEICPECGGLRLLRQGAGTQRVEEELSELFTGTGVVRMDADTTGGKQSHESLLAKFRDERVPILLGTQMITKGLDFENVTLVGVLAADQGLNIPDFRAGERTFSQITQVVGRAGRGEKSGLAVIQTYSPDSPVLRLAAAQDYGGFYESEIAFRESFGYPPFCDICMIEVSGEENTRVYGAAAHVRELAAGLGLPGTEVFDPVPAPVFRVNNRLRYRVILKTEDTKPVRDGISGVLRAFMAEKRFKGLGIYAVFNPLE